MISSDGWTIDDGGYDCTLPALELSRNGVGTIHAGSVDALGDKVPGTVNLTYTIDNPSYATLLVTGVTATNLTNVSGFSSSATFPITIPASGTDTIEISFTVDGAGPFSLDMDILNNSTTNPYTITISGEGNDAPVILGPPDGTSTTDHTPNFDWEDVPGAVSYIIQVSPTDNISILPINHTVTNSFFAPGISMINQQYWWRVTANMGGSLTDWSEVRTITIAGAPGNAAPVAVSPADGATTSDRTPTFDWTDVPTAVRYRIQMSTTPGFGVWLVNQTTTASTWTPGMNFNPGTYYWRVQAEGGGDSSWFTVKREITIVP